MSTTLRKPNDEENTVVEQPNSASTFPKSKRDRETDSPKALS